MAQNKTYPLSVVIQGVDKISAPLRKINERIRGMGAPFRRLGASLGSLARESGLVRLASDMRQVGARTRDAVGEAFKLGKRLAALTVVAAGMTFGLVNSVAASGDEIAKTADKIGLGVEALQELRFAADRQGIAQASLDMSMQRFGRRLGEASVGAGAAKVAIEALGLSSKELAEMPLDQALAEVADQLSKVRNANLRNALAMKLFDSEGVVMVNLLREGSSGMQALRDEARSLGKVMSEQAARDSENFVDTMTNMKAVLDGIRITIGTALMPVVESMVKQFTAFALDNREAIAAWAQTFAGEFPDRIRQLTGFLVNMYEAVSPLISAVGWMADVFGASNLVLTALAVTMGGKLLVSLIYLAGAIKALGITLALTPVGWFIGAVAAIGASVYMIYKHWDKIAEWFTAKFDAVKAAFSEGFLKGLLAMFAEFSPVVLVAEAINDVVKYLTGYDIGAAAGKFVDRMKEGFIARWESVKEWMRGAVENLTGWMPDWMRERMGLDSTPGPQSKAEQWEQGAPSPMRQPTTADPRQPVPRALQGRPFSSQAERLMTGDNGQVRPGLVNTTQTTRSEAAIKVEFDNMPRGTRVRETRNTGAELEMDMGWSMAMP